MPSRDPHTIRPYGRHDVPAKERYAAIEPRRIPPSGEVSPDGRRTWPEPSLTSKILVLGGAGIMAAAATAGAVLATRRIAGMIAGDEEHPVARPRLAPRYAALDEDEREAMRRRSRERARSDAAEAARNRVEAARARDLPRRSTAESLTDTATQLAGSLNGVMGSLTGAVAGFRSVAAQAGGILREFTDAADTVRAFLEDRNGRARRDAAEALDSAARRAAETRSAEERALRARESRERADADDRLHRL